MNNLEDTLHPKTRTSAKSVFHNYVIQTSERNELSDFLKQRGIETKSITYSYLSSTRLEKTLASFSSNTNCRKTKRRNTSLPIYELTDAEIEYIAKSVITFFNEKNLYREAV